MSKPFSWTIFTGLLVMIAGAVGVWSIIQHNLPSPFDNPDAGAQSGSFLPIIAPANASVSGGKSGATAVSAPTLATGSTPTATSSSQPTQTPAVGLTPERIVIPIIHLDAPIVPVNYKQITYDGKVYDQWVAPNQFSAGWQDTSALLGLPGNTVLNGHHNEYGKVFKDLVTLNVGDEIDLYSGNQVFRYQVEAKMLLPEREATLAVRLQNARWIAPSTDERITLVTCWPANSNTHRVIVVAVPINSSTNSSTGASNPGLPQQ